MFALTSTAGHRTIYVYLSSFHAPQNCYSHSYSKLTMAINHSDYTIYQLYPITLYPVIAHYTAALTLIASLTSYSPWRWRYPGVLLHSPALPEVGCALSIFGQANFFPKVLVHVLVDAERRVSLQRVSKWFTYNLCNLTPLFILVDTSVHIMDTLVFEDTYFFRSPPIEKLKSAFSNFIIFPYGQSLCHLYIHYQKEHNIVPYWYFFNILPHFMRIICWNISVIKVI